VLQGGAVWVFCCPKLPGIKEHTKPIRAIKYLGIFFNKNKSNFYQRADNFLLVKLCCMFILGQKLTKTHNKAVAANTIIKNIGNIMG
jgi:hypothetical protein